MRVDYRIITNTLALVTLVVGLIGCAGPTTPAPSASPTEAPGAVAEASDALTDTTVIDTSSAEGSTLTEEELANATYPVDLTPSGLIPLENGEYSEPIVEGSASMLTVTMGQVAYGDLNGDGVEDAAVILNANSGGTGTNAYMSAVISHDGEAEAVTSALLGDRVQVNSLAIADEVITLEMVTQGPNDPMCCPTQVVTNTYQLEGLQLTLTSTLTSTTEPE